MTFSQFIPLFLKQCGALAIISELLLIFLTLSNALSRVVSNKKDVVREFRTMTSYARREINSDLCFNTFPHSPFQKLSPALL